MLTGERLSGLASAWSSRSPELPRDKGLGSGCEHEAPQHPKHANACEKPFRYHLHTVLLPHLKKQKVPFQRTLGEQRIHPHPPPAPGSHERPDVVRPALKSERDAGDFSTMLEPLQRLRAATPVRLANRWGLPEERMRIHSFIPQIITEHLLCSRHYFRCWRLSYEQKRQIFLPWWGGP